MQFSTLTIRTPDGLALRGDLAVPDACVGAAVVCHPHPLYGGNRHNPVVTALVQAFHGCGLATVHFDFRGVGESEGTHGEGVAERLDAQAALDVAAEHAGGGALVMSGYSFGSMVALDVVDPRITAWVAVAPPLGMMPNVPASSTDPRPKQLLVPEHDQYSAPDATRGRSSDWVATELAVIPMADHFLAGRTAVVGELTAAFVSGLGGR
jgi:hypothetical protein